jgi:diguanylate cyclase (GGDEF)-like protein
LGLLRLDHSKIYFYTQDDLRFLSAISDIGAIGIENSQLFQRVQDLAIHDSLTGLYTKSFFLSRFKEEHKRSLRQNLPLSLIMIDIDFFKQYNDRFGHAAGDIVLVKISKMIAASFKKFNPLISRFGGEEFCVVMPGLEKGFSFDVAESFRKELEKKTFILRRNKTRVTVSIGLANIPEDTLDDEELIRKADRVMYLAKEKGRNKVCCI